MVRTPTIIKKSDTEDGFIAELFIPKDLYFFQGHFDEFPLVPGVCQLKWVIELSKDTLDDKSSTNIKKLKFMHPIRPEDKLTLKVSFKANQQLSFSYYADDRVYSQGTLDYA